MRYVFAGLEIKAVQMLLKGEADLPELSGGEPTPFALTRPVMRGLPELPILAETFFTVPHIRPRMAMGGASKRRHGRRMPPRCLFGA
jgi:hypothetical protein